MQSIKCTECGREFTYKLVGTVFPGGKERESIDCPYCGKVNGTVMTSQIVETKKLDKTKKLSKTNRK